MCGKINKPQAIVCIECSTPKMVKWFSSEGSSSGGTFKKASAGANFKKAYQTKWRDRRFRK